MTNRHPSTEVRHGSARRATFSVERPKNITPAARVFIFPGLLGTELSYGATSNYISSRLPLEVITMTHGREAERIMAPMKARSADCLAVLKKVGNSSLPNFIIGHSLGGADAVHVANYVKRNNIAGIGLETSVGLSEATPEIMNVLSSMKTNFRHLPLDFLVEATKYAACNPVLASLEAVHAKRSNIRSSVEGLGSLVMLEAYNSEDIVIRPPRREGCYKVRKGFNHLAICQEPEIGLDYGAVFLEYVETLANRPTV